MEKTKSSKYWENRKEWLIYHQMESADKTADRIGKLYHRAYLEIEKKMNNVLDRFAFKYRMSREQALDILERLNNKNDVDELIKELRLHGDNIDIKELSMMMDSPSYWYRINALKDTMAEVDTVMKLVYNNELAVSTEHYKKAANDSFLKNTYTLQQQTGYGYRVSTLPPETVSKLLKSKWSGANYSKRIWNNTTTLAGDLKTELLTSVLMGRTESETMKIFLNKFAVGANTARRLIRTESAYIYNQMDTEAYKESGIEYYRFVATLDLKTSKVCQELDGKVFKTTDAQVGVNFPPMHPWCRSVTIANIDDDTLKTLDRRAGKEKVPADMTYKEWEDRFVVDDEKLHKQPFDKVEIKNSSDAKNKVRTKKQFEMVTNDVLTEINNYTSNSSKWSGNVNVVTDLIDGDAVGVKEWSCDITVINTADDGVIWHEMLHSCSVSYYEPEIYIANEYIEEATVEWLKQQICAEKNIVNLPAYEDKTIVLQTLNESFSFGTSMEFAKEIFNVPLPKRYQWLENRVDECLRQAGASFEDYNDVMRFVEKLKGGRNG